MGGRESTEKSSPAFSLTSISEEIAVSPFIIALKNVLSTYYIKIVEKGCQMVINVAGEQRRRVRGS